MTLVLISGGGTSDEVWDQNLRAHTRLFDDPWPNNGTPCDGHGLIKDYVCCEHGPLQALLGQTDENIKEAFTTAKSPYNGQ